MVIAERCSPTSGCCDEAALVRPAGWASPRPLSSTRPRSGVASTASVVVLGVVAVVDIVVDIVDVVVVSPSSSSSD